MIGEGVVIEADDGDLTWHVQPPYPQHPEGAERRGQGAGKQGRGAAAFREPEKGLRSRRPPPR
jgi:hypothetical protein